MGLESVIHQGIQKVRVGKKKIKENQGKKSDCYFVSVWFGQVQRAESTSNWPSKSLIVGLGSKVLLKVKMW